VDLPPGGALDVFKVDEYALRRFRAQIDLGGGILRDALMGLDIRVNLRMSV
jgi:hypothetical protein